MNSDINNKIKEYLWFGYLQPKKIKQWIISDINSEEYDYMYDSFEDRLNHTFDDICSKISGKHIVPLSGGWDSRIILGELINRYNADEIETVTFGTPGQLDFDIAKYISKKTGIRCNAVNLKEVDFSWDALDRSLPTCPWTYVPDGHVNRMIFSNYKDNNVWSGFLGDPVAGSHFLKDSTNNLDKEYHKFTIRQKRTRFEFIHDEYVPEMPKGIFESDVFSYNEAFDFSIRQASCISPIIFPDGNWNYWKAVNDTPYKGFFLTPFADINWANYMLNAPRKLHENQNFYLSMSHKKLGRLMEYKAKQYWGYGMNDKFLPQLARFGIFARNRASYVVRNDSIRSAKMNNYIDFARSFREDKIWINNIEVARNILGDKSDFPIEYFDEIVKKHSEFQDRTQEILVLLGLALNLNRL